MKRKFIGAADGAGIFLSGICVGNILGLFLSLALSKTSASLDGMSVQNWVGYIVMQLGFLAAILVFAKIRKVDEIAVSRIKKPRNLWQLALTPLIAIAAILIFLPFANLWMSFLNLIGYKVTSVAMPEYSNVGYYFLSLLIMAVLPAFMEELLMRGNVFHAFSTKNVWFGILISSLFFSIMHANPLQTVHQFGLGIVLAITIILTDSYFAAVLVHFFNNFISITLTAYLPEVDALYVKLGYWNYLTGFVSVIVGLVLILILFYSLYRLGHKNGDGGDKEAIEYEYFTLYVPNEKVGYFKGLGKFFKSLFTKDGWRKINRILTVDNGVEKVNQRLVYVWIALGIIVAYWLYVFIVGLI